MSYENIKTLHDLLFGNHFSGGIIDKAPSYSSEGDKSPAIFWSEASFNSSFGTTARQIPDLKYNKAFRKQTYQSILKSESLPEAAVPIVRNIFLRRLNKYTKFDGDVINPHLLIQLFDQLTNSSVFSSSIDYNVIHQFVLGHILPPSGEERDPFLAPSKAKLAILFLEASQKLTQPVHEYLLNTLKPEEHSAGQRLALTAFFGEDAAVKKDATIVLKSSMGENLFSALEQQIDMARIFIRTSRELTANDQERLLSAPKHEQRALIETLKLIALNL